MINLNNFIKTFFQLVQIDSITGEELNLSNYLKTQIAKLGYSAQQDKRGNLVVQVKGQGKPLLLAAHLDTVEPGRGIVPVLKNGVIRSKGQTILGADNKITVAAYLELFKVLKQNKNHRSLEFLFSVSEEAGISGIDTLDLSWIKATQGLCLDASFPVGTIILSSPSYLRIELEFIGRQADTSKSTHGQDVLKSLSYFLAHLKQGQINPDCSCNFGLLQAGQAINSVMSQAKIFGEIRAFNRQALKAQKAKIKKLLLTAGKIGDSQIKYWDCLENTGYQFRPNHSLVKEVQTQFQGIAPVKFIERYRGVSDANNLNRRGIKTLNLGYGVKNSHTTKEQVTEKTIEKLVNFLVNLISSQ